MTAQSPSECSQKSTRACIFIITQSNVALELLGKIIYVIKQADAEAHMVFGVFCGFAGKCFFGERRRERPMPETKNHNLQDLFLNQLRKDRVPVVMFLTNGVRLKGIVKGFDNFVVLLKDATEQLIYKHAISTIVPEKNFEVKTEGGENKQ